MRLRSLGDTTGDKWQDLDVSVATDEGPRQATKFYVNGMEQVVSVETSRGYRIQGTPTHRIKVVDEHGDWVWRRMADLKSGDRVPMMLGGMVGEPCEVAAAAAWRSALELPSAKHPRAARDAARSWRSSSATSWATARCTRRACASASRTETTMSSSGSSSSARELFGSTAHVLPREGYTELSFHSVPLTIWWEACGFAKLPPYDGHSGKGWVPRGFLTRCCTRTMRRHLRRVRASGLFEADGNANNGYAYWSTTNEQFSRDVQTLLLSLGFVTTRSIDDARGKLGGPCHRLRLLNAASAARFVDEVGFMSERKNEALLCDDHPQAARYDHVPVEPRAGRRARAGERPAAQDDLLLQLARTGTVPRRSATALLERAHECRAGAPARLLLRRGGRAPSCSRISRRSISSVPDNVTYVANGFVSHNTISFLMDCDTTGIEPDFSLVKFKELVGGGQMTIVNRTVPLALADARLLVRADRGRSRRTWPPRARSSAPRVWRTSTCRCSTWRSGSGPSRRWATSR